MVVGQESRISIESLLKSRAVGFDRITQTKFKSVINSVFNKNSVAWSCAEFCGVELPRVAINCAARNCTQVKSTCVGNPEKNPKTNEFKDLLNIL